MDNTSDNSPEPDVPGPPNETTEQNEPMEQGESDSGLEESRTEDSYQALTPDELHDVVNQAAAASTDKVKRQVSRLARRALQFDSRLSRVERETVRGNLKIEGKNVPPAVRGENLFSIIQDLVLSMFGTRLYMSDIGHIRRLGLKKRSPILIKFLSTHSSSIMYKISDPKNISKMKSRKIFFNRFQTSEDRKIFTICAKLKENSVIQGCFVDRNHISTIINYDNTVKAIYDIETFANIFNNSHFVSTIVNKYREVEDEDDENIVPTEAPAPETVSTPAVNIIDVVDDTTDDE